MTCCLLLSYGGCTRAIIIRVSSPLMSQFSPIFIPNWWWRSLSCIWQRRITKYWWRSFYNPISKSLYVILKSKIWKKLLVCMCVQVCYIRLRKNVIVFVTRALSNIERGLTRVEILYIHESNRMSLAWHHSTSIDCLVGTSHSKALLSNYSPITQIVWSLSINQDLQKKSHTVTGTCQ